MDKRYVDRVEWIAKELMRRVYSNQDWVIIAPETFDHNQTLGFNEGSGGSWPMDFKLHRISKCKLALSIFSPRTR